MKKFLCLVAFAVMAFSAYAQEDLPGQGFLDQVMKWLTSAHGASTTVAVIVELLFRVIPSKKPLSILRMVAGLAKLVGEILIKFSDLSDKVLPQKIEERPEIKL